MSELGQRLKPVSTSDFGMQESMCGEWTNEKHSSYLNSMEAMFVKQLYNHEYDGMDSPHWRSRRKNQLNPSSAAQSNLKPHTPGQFKVFESGCWTAYDSVETHSKTTIVRRNATNSKQSPNIEAEDQCQDSSYCYTEVSDQNFVDDEPKQTNHMSRKRTKGKVANTTFNDQVVPTSQSPIAVNAGKYYKGGNHNATTQDS